MRLLVVLVLGVCFSCAKPADSTCLPVALKDKASFPVGTAFNFGDYKGSPEMAGLFHTHFNSLSPENALKYATIRPVLNAPYNFSEIDSLLRIAQPTGIRVHGHTLIWHQQLPAWLEQYPGNFTELMETHIHEVVSHFGNSISSWDVVNEALTEQGALRTSPWQTKVGNDYIYKAFKAAQLANPDAVLFYNDYNLALNPVKLNAAIALCNSLRERGIVHLGIGMQLHITPDFPTRIDLARTTEKIWRAGFQVHYSEVDISLNVQGGKAGFSPADLETQARAYRDVAEVYKQIPAHYQFGITLWGIGDADSWIPSYFNRTDAPLLFDEGYTAKPAFCTFLSSL